MEGKIIKIIGSTSVFKEFLGRYGVVKEYAYGDKWKVEFNATTEITGALIHTVSEKDFEVVGKINWFSILKNSVVVKNAATKNIERVKKNER